jgi:hemerythrin
MPYAFPEELAVGIHDVDDQHRAFYRHLNDLHAAMRRGDVREATRLVDFLVSYASEHFATEERLMIGAGYPGLREHLERHREFVEALKGWQARIAERGPTASLVVDLSNWLTGWLGEHIRKVDAAMARHVRGRTPSP